MSNPFSNQKIQNSSDYLSKKSNISQMQTIKRSKKGCFNKSISIRNNKLVRASDFKELLNFTKGYYLTQPCCYDKREKALNITDGRYTTFDFKNIKIRNDGLTECCDKIDNYEFDNCRVKKGLIVPNAEINPKFKTKFFKLHKTSSMIVKQNNYDIGFRNNGQFPKIHQVSECLNHKHYFPTNTKDISYMHSHDDGNTCCSDFPKCKHPGCFDHINGNTNQYYLAKDYFSDDIIGTPTNDLYTNDSTLNELLHHDYQQREINLRLQNWRNYLKNRNLPDDEIEKRVEKMHNNLLKQNMKSFSLPGKSLSNVGRSFHMPKSFSMAGKNLLSFKSKSKKNCGCK